jgi:hypothetical protein
MARRIRRESSPLTDLMDYYEDDMTRENYIATNYLGEVGPDDDIPEDVESDWPEQFKRKTLLDASLMSARVQ